MANQEHVDRLLQGVEAWNQWKQRHRANPDADLSGANLKGADLRNVNFFHIDLSNANLEGANLTGANLTEANLTGANLSNAHLNSTNLTIAILRNAVINNAHLSGAHLGDADLTGAKLNGAKLIATQVLGTNFNMAVLTGACILDWNINSRTNLQDVVCEYIFTKWDWRNDQFTDRRPHDPNQNFAPGEFTKRYQIVLETVDLFFNDGIDWKAFLASLQDLKTEYGEDLSLQGIEKKAGGSFVVRLEVPSDANKGTIEREIKALYATNLQILEAKYHAELQAKDKEIESYKRENANMTVIAQLLASRPITVENEVVVEQKGNSENHYVTVHGNAGTIVSKAQDNVHVQTNQYIGANLDEITTLIHALRGKVESFPEAQRSEAIDHLTDLETDLKQPPGKRKPSRMKAALLALVGIATAVSGAVTSTNEFVGQVHELSEKLGIELPIEQLQPQSQPQAIDVKAIGSDRS